MRQKKLFRFCYDFTGYEIITFCKFVSCPVFPENDSYYVSCVLAKAVVDGKVPSLGFISMHKRCYNGKNC